MYRYMYMYMHMSMYIVYADDAVLPVAVLNQHFLTLKAEIKVLGQRQLR